MCVTSRAISVRVIRALPLACIRDLPQCSRTCHTVLTTHHSAHHTSSFFFTLYLEPVSGAQIRASRYGPIHIRAPYGYTGPGNKQARIWSVNGARRFAVRGPPANDLWPDDSIYTAYWGDSAATDATSRLEAPIVAGLGGPRTLLPGCNEELLHYGFHPAP